MTTTSIQGAWRRRSRLPIWLVAGLSVLTACGGSAGGTVTGATTSNALASAPTDSASAGGADTTTSASLGSLNACTLLTAADFETVDAKLDPGGAAPKISIRTEQTKTDVGPAVDQHRACIYHFSGDPGVSGELTLDVMTSAEYKTLDDFLTPKPIAGLGDEAAVFGERPAVRVGDRAALIANSSTMRNYGIEVLRVVAPRLQTG